MSLPESSGELLKLIHKLRWIGLEEEARRLECVARSLPPEERGTVLEVPVSTD
jgi:hypothetical protein